MASIRRSPDEIQIAAATIRAAVRLYIETGLHNQEVAVKTMGAVISKNDRYVLRINSIHAAVPAMFLMAFAAELILKHVWEKDRERSAPRGHDGHDLSKLFLGLPQHRRTYIEKGYREIFQIERVNAPLGWETAEKVFYETRMQFEAWRYAREGNDLPVTYPFCLSTAIVSVFDSEGYELDADSRIQLWAVAIKENAVKDQG